MATLLSANNVDRAINHLIDMAQSLMKKLGHR